MSTPKDTVVSLNSSGILGVVSGAPKVEGPVAKAKTRYCDTIQENAGLVQTYAAMLGQIQVKQDLLEALDGADPKANSENRDVTAHAMAAGLGISGLNVNIHSRAKLRPAQWPAIAHMTNDQFVLVYRQTDDGVVVYDDTQVNQELLVPLAEFEPYFTGTLIKAAATVDQLRETHIAKPEKGHWFWSEFFKYKVLLGDIAVGSFVANLLAVAVALFSLQVYDRVIPHESTATLWVLAIGAFVAIGLEALLKISRARLMDGAGRAIELTVQDILMGRLLGMKSDKRPMG
ncbi:MAG: cysteine peptidase family C39 domain-containing protein, partial [Planktomarina sp.]